MSGCGALSVRRARRVGLGALWCAAGAVYFPDAEDPKRVELNETQLLEPKKEGGGPENHPPA